MNFKKILLALFAIALNITAFAQLKYQIIGTMKSVPDYKVTVTLYYAAPNGSFVSDTCQVKESKFNFSGVVSRPVPAYLAVTEGDDNLTKALSRGVFEPDAVKLIQIGMFLENGKILANLDYEHQADAIITGTPNNNSLQSFRPIMNNYKAMEASIYAKNKASGNDATRRDLLLKDYNDMVAKRSNEVGAFIKKHPESLAGMDFLGRWINPAENLADAKKYFDFLSPERQNSPAGRRYLDRIKRAGNVDLGAMAPDFVLPDSSGTLHKLSEFRGKYVLLDFWASWCAPCRNEIPNLINTYKQFREKKFEILGISLDGGNPDSKEKWLGAIKQDKVTWPQFSDLKGFSSNVASIYAVAAIPVNVLIDPSGKIIAKNLHGQQLNDFLKKLF